MCKIQGFSLIELLVAMVVFLVVSGMAFSVFNQHAPLVLQQQNLSGMNIGLRNSMAELEMDLAGAAENLLSSVQVAGVQPFSLGVIIQNNVPGVAATCAPTGTSWSYPTSSACYDSLTILNPKAGAPVLAITGGTENLSSSSTVEVSDPNNGNLTTDASYFSTGDEVLVYQPNGTGSACSGNSGAAPSYYCMTIVTLTADATVSSGEIELQYNPVQTDGQPSGCPGSSCGDLMGIIWNPANAQGSNFTNALGVSFSSGAYLIDMGTGANDITYSVQPNPDNAADPQLMRCPGTACTASNEQALTDQVIGFKVGAALWNSEQADMADIGSYFYNAANYCNGSLSGANCTATPPTANDPYDFTLIRSVRISMIARTSPGSDQLLARFENGFDGGPYLVQQASVVVDLRNMSINEFGN